MKERLEQVARGPFHTTPIFVKRAHGSLVEDVDGNILLDFASGIGVVNVGHTNEAVVSAIQEQAAQLIHSSFNVLPYESYVRVAEKLNQLTPGTFKKKTFLANSGAEAVENALKIARAATGRPATICFEHAFHGRTFMAMALTAKEKPYKQGFGPLSPDVYRAPFPDPYRWNSGPDKATDEAFTSFLKVADQVGPEKIASVIIEPVLGEGGFIPVPREFFAKLSEFCTDNKTILIADEIQTGFGRTGTLFACEQLGVVPDIMVTAKGIAGGMVLSGVTGRAEVMDAPCEGGIGGTFGGNPVSCAAALAVFDIFGEKEFLQRLQIIGERVGQTLGLWLKKFPLIGDVRGLGPMRAIEFVKDRQSKEPYPEAAKALVKYCFEHGLVTMTAGTYGNVLRLLFPLVITDAELREGLDVIEQGLTQLK